MRRDNSFAGILCSCKDRNHPGHTSVGNIISEYIEKLSHPSGPGVGNRIVTSDKLTKIWIYHYVKFSNAFRIFPNCTINV